MGSREKKGRLPRDFFVITVSEEYLSGQMREWRKVSALPLAKKEQLIPLEGMGKERPGKLQRQDCM